MPEDIVPGTDVLQERYLKLQHAKLELELNLSSKHHLALGCRPILHHSVETRDANNLTVNVVASFAIYYVTNGSRL